MSNLTKVCENSDRKLGTIIFLMALEYYRAKLRLQNAKDPNARGRTSFPGRAVSVTVHMIYVAKNVEARAFNQQPTATGPLAVNHPHHFHSHPLRAAISRTPPTTFLVSVFFFVIVRGSVFRGTRLPRCGCLRGTRIRSEFRKIRDLESLQSSVSILYI